MDSGTSAAMEVLAKLASSKVATAIIVGYRGKSLKECELL